MNFGIMTLDDSPIKLLCSVHVSAVLNSPASDLLVLLERMFLEVENYDLQVVAIRCGIKSFFSLKKKIERPDLIKDRNGKYRLWTARVEPSHGALGIQVSNAVSPKAFVWDPVKV